ncbi:MAG: hypothetical protein LW838_06590, partial [Nitrosomonadaceae bacterium]|nr:hypothetical protein [Nitrosomonadaceae bacterium]
MSQFEFSKSQATKNPPKVEFSRECAESKSARYQPLIQSAHQIARLRIYATIERIRFNSSKTLPRGPA